MDRLIALPMVVFLLAAPASAALRWSANYGTNLDLAQWTRLDCGGQGGSCPCLVGSDSWVTSNYGAGRCDYLDRNTSSSHTMPNPIAPGAGSRLQVTPDPAGSGNNVLRVQLAFGDAFSDGASTTTRVELAYDRSKSSYTNYVAGDDLFFAFSVYFPSAYFDHWHCTNNAPSPLPSSYDGRCPNGVPDTSAGVYSAWNVTTQWHSPGSPSFGFGLQRLYESSQQQYQLHLTSFDGGIWHDAGDPSKGGALWTDTWYHFIVHIRFGNPGVMELWESLGNGPFVKQTMNGTHNDVPGPGGYQPTACLSLADNGRTCNTNTLSTGGSVVWKQGHYRVPTLTDPTTLYYNHTRVGDTYDDVAAGMTNPSPDFTLSVSPSSVSSAPGGTATTTATVTAQNGFSGTVSFSVSGMPSGASASFNPASVAGSGSSTLTLSAGTAPAGTYPLTVTGTSGTLTHSAPLGYAITTGGGGIYSDAVWIKQVGTALDEYGWAAATDPSGNVIMAGYTTGSLGAANQGGQDVVVSKYSSAGTALWTTQLGSAGDEHAYGVATDAAGNIYVTGSTTDALWGPYSGGAHDGFVAKWGPNGGGELWSNPIGSAGDDIAYAVAVDAAGNIYVAGSTTGSFGGTNAGGTDAWVAKYDQWMTPLWVRQFGGSANEVARGVALDASGNVYVAGHTTGAFGGAAYNGGAHDAFLVKFNSGGTLQWTMIRGTTGDDMAYAVTVTGGNPVVCGSTTGDLAYTNAGAHDAWVGEYRASDAGYVFERQLGSAGEDEAFGVAANAAGDVFITGSNTASLSPNFRGGYDIFVAKYNSSGTRQWIKTLGSSGNEVGLATAVSGASVYVVGGTTAALGGPFLGGGFDIIVAQFAQ